MKKSFLYSTIIILGLASLLASCSIGSRPSGAPNGGQPPQMGSGMQAPPNGDSGQMGQPPGSNMDTDR